MSAHFEIARTSASPQSWHARLVVGGLMTWGTENYSRQVGAERAICSLIRHLTGRDAYLIWNVKGAEKVAVLDGVDLHTHTVRYVDERVAP